MAIEMLSYSQLGERLTQSHNTFLTTLENGRRSAEATLSIAPITAGSTRAEI
jgi:hypothetical protein